MAQTAFEKQHLLEVRAWRDAAKADGWAATPTYGDSESIDRACRLKRDGFSVQVITREGDYASASLHAWGPDGLALNIPWPYNFAKLRANTRICSACKAKDVPTERVGFAGRVCANCLPEQRRLIETRGWCD